MDLIRVGDDGCGIRAADLWLACQRHATSKYPTEGLTAVRTLGFRGEALPSIAAVSRLTLRTKTAGTTAGFRLVVEAGREIDAGEVGIADGTQIEVRDLFFTTPARLQFLQSAPTELSATLRALTQLALAHPEVQLRVTNNGRA